jgi:hypothetical protein
MQIAATMPLRKNTHGWLVPSQAGHGSYTVSPAHRADHDTNRYLCTCPDFELRGLPCKHVIAVELTIKREYGADGEVVAEEVKVTYTQNWTAYNAAQCAEKDMFLPMLAELCSTIPQPPQGRGRPRLPMSDMAFDAIHKVYSGFSARRFDSDVREATSKGLTAQDAHFNSVLRYLRSPEMTPVLKELVTLSAMPLKAVETDFAVDATGFTTCNYVRWYDHKWGKEQVRREWMKLHAMTGVRTNVVTSVEVTPHVGEGTSDSRNFIPLVQDTARNFEMRDVTADKAYSGKANLQTVSDLGATPYIPFKNSRGSYGGVCTSAINAVAIHQPLPWAPAWTRMYHMFAYQRDTFLARYHQRSNVETTFSMIKAKFGGSLRSKSATGQINEVLCKVIAHNLCVLISCIHEIGLEMPQFGQVAADVRAV